MPDRAAYDASEVDWITLNNLATLIARTLSPPTPEGWVLETRRWRLREYLGTKTEPVTEESTEDYTYGITAEGKLFTQVRSNYEVYNPAHTGDLVDPETVKVRHLDEVVVFDFNRQVRETRRENRDIRSDREPGDELLHVRKGDGLRARLEAMLGVLSPEELQRIRQQARQRESEARIEKEEARSTAIDARTHYDASRVDWPPIAATARETAQLLPSPPDGGDHWALETRESFNRIDAADDRAENQEIRDQYSDCLRTDGTLFLRHEREVTRYHPTTAGSLHTDAPEVEERPLTEADVRLLDFQAGSRYEEFLNNPVRFIRSNYLAGEQLLCSSAGERLMQLLTDLPTRESEAPLDEVKKSSGVAPEVKEAAQSERDELEAPKAKGKYRVIPFRNGKVISGYAITSTGTTVTIEMPDGKQVEYQRSDLLYGDGYVYSQGEDVDRRKVAVIEEQIRKKIAAMQGKTE
jgi:hypothetical protein